MTDPSDTRRPGSGRPPDDRLDSWKAIAAYLGRGIRTVQRWEREEGLPVHRLAHEKRGTVYARRDELAAWWDSRRITLAAQSSDEADSFDTRGAPHLERVTLTSSVTAWAALSSDTRLIAYVSDGGQDGTTPQIWVQQVGGAALQLTNSERQYSHLSFSPDDTRIVFTAVDAATGPNVYEVPTLGGEPRLVQRGATSARFSPDGRWLSCVAREAVGIRIAARGGVGFRTVASELVDVACAAWAPDSRAVVVHARPDPALEPDWWVVPINGDPPTNTHVVRLFREAGLFTVPIAAAWVDDSLLFTAAGARGVCLYRQRIAPFTFQPAGDPEQLSAGREAAWLFSAAARRVAFLSSRDDMNLWSVALDPASGVAYGPLRRLTRGPFPLGYLSVTTDFRTLAYFSFRLGHGDVFLRDLQTGSERVLAEGPPGDKGYPAISPSGKLVAFGTRMPGGEQALRPIFTVCLSDGTWRKLGDDCGGRPREWVDERRLVIERFARLNSIAVVDTESAAQRELLRSAEQSVRNPRLSPDRGWITFDVSRPGEPSSVCVAPFREQPIPESEWVIVERSASHPFWSADGRFVYYTPTGTNPIVRSSVHARYFACDSGQPGGEPKAVYASTELMMPAYLPGTAPIATPDQIIFVLGDFRGDVWLMDI